MDRFKDGLGHPHELKACPACESERVTINRDETKWWTVFCVDCGCETEPRPNETLAGWAWWGFCFDTQWAARDECQDTRP